MEVKRLSTSESLLLDVIRVLAAAVVAFGHLSQRFFSTRWPNLTTYAQGAVAVFFVLSGFVIRHVTTRHRSDFKAYLGDRLSRIYSVAIPALIFTLIADSISRRVNPSFYAFWVGEYNHPLRRILENLAFTGQFWWRFRDPLSNSPYWSISYEMAYYLGYGCFFYLSGKARWISIAALCLLFGPRVVLLAPLWIAGCVVHDLYQRWNAAGTTAANLTRLFAALFLLAPVGLLVLRLNRLLAHTHPHLYIPTYPPDQRLFPIHYLFGIVWAALFMALLFFARRISIDPGTSFARNVRFIADGTFPIYLFHFPIYVLIAATIPYNHGSPLPKILIFIGVVIIGILAGRPCNFLKDKLRSFSIPIRSREYISR
jgi:peptidoglycan/LPS O-acetylase OafA/YrhL